MFTNQAKLKKKKKEKEKTAFAKPSPLQNLPKR